MEVRVSSAHTPALFHCENEHFHGQNAGSSKLMVACKSVSQHLCSAGIKTGLGLLKVASSQWKQDNTRSDASAQLQRRSNQCGQSPLDNLAALVLQNHSRHRQLGQDHQTDPGCRTKPQNCRRIVVLGAPRVGKTSILRRYLRDGFVEEYKPTSEDFLRKLFRIRGETYQIDILDASKERDFPAKRRLSILTGDIFLLVFSVDDRSSFEEVCALRTEILSAKSKLPKPCAPLVVCANKVDVHESDRQVHAADILQTFGPDCAYFETSAKDSTNLEQVFETLARSGGLPTETGPSQHRKVSLRSYQAMRSGRAHRRGAQGPRGEDPCGALYPLARRPSFSTDLRHVITEHKPHKALEKCRIQ